MIRPIFTLGAARNGTTWLGNHLATYPEVGCAQHELHHGIHESNIVAHYRWWGTFSTPDQYLSFLSQYQFEDYFTLVGGDPEYFLVHPQPDFFTFFCELNDQYCRKNNLNFWTTKLDPQFSLYPELWELFLTVLSERYQDVYYISIKRELKPCLKSYVNMEGKYFEQRSSKIGAALSMPLGVVRYTTQYAWIDKVIAERGGVGLTFRKVIGNPKAFRTKIDGYLMLNEAGRAAKIPFRQNTSFVKKDPRPLSGIQTRLIDLTLMVTKISPWVGRQLYYAYERFKPEAEPTYRKLLKSKYFPVEFKRERDLRHDR